MTLWRALVRSPYGLPAFIAIAVIGLTALRALADELSYAIGLSTWGMFFTPDDRFADFVKTALSYKFITGSIINQPSFAIWPALFKTYFLQNPYDGPVLTNFHIMPVTTLMMMAAAKLIVMFSPQKAYCTFVAAYGLATLALAQRSLALTKLTVTDIFTLALILLASWPALFLLTRGNFPAGFTSILICAYVVNGLSEKSRWLGWLALALAINMRPNVAVLAILEFCLCPTIMKASTNIAIAAVMSVMVFAMSFFLAEHIYPAYTLSNIEHGLSIYDQFYIRGDSGDRWNVSLMGVAKHVRTYFKLRPYYSDLTFMWIVAFGACLFLTSTVLLALKRLSAAEAMFLGIAFSCLFTPVIAVYHMLELAAVLLLVMDERTRIPSKSHLLILSVTILSMSPLGGYQSDGVIIPLLLLLGVLGTLYCAANRKETTPQMVQHRLA